jgi:hypothetical protein
LTAQPRRRLVALGLGCTLLLGGCTTVAAVDHRSHGSLTIHGGGGGASLAVPDGVDQWWGTFHVAELCADSPVTIVSAMPIWRSRPQSWRLWVRRVDNYDVHKRATSVLGTARGTPPDFAEPYAQIHLSGKFADAVGQTIENTSCDIRSGHYVELILSVKSGSQGADAAGVSIEYENERGETATVESRGWRMVTCGSRHIKWLCSGS